MADPEPKLSLPLSFEELFASAVDAIIVHDLENQVLVWNQSAAKLYGWSAEEVKGRAVERILYLDTQLREAAVRQLNEEGTWVGELRQVDREGDEHLVRVRQQLHRDSQGQGVAIVSFNTDITEERKREDAEVRARHIRSSSILAGGLAHELNNALAPIMLSAAMLKRTIEDEKSKDMLGMIEKCATKSAALITDLLAFERGKGGGTHILRKTQVDRALQRAAQAVVVEERVDLQLDVAEDLWECRGEISELTEVFQYVMQNACEAMPEGGKLVVQVSNRLFDENFENLAPEAKAGAYVTFVFTDSGHGIEAEHLAHVAEPFFTTKEPKHGFGFGLTNSQAIIKGHKGFMMLESDRGQGTKLSIFLPAEMSVDEVKGSAPPFPVEEGNGLLILVVDDEFFIRETIKKSLKERGYKVITAQDGTEALAVYASRINEVSLVVTNVDMPFMDGPSLSRALKRLDPDVKILVSSGHLPREKIQEIRASGVEHFLTKPYTADHLAGYVHSILIEDSDDRTPVPD